jgi:hypothetical protein
MREARTNRQTEGRSAAPETRDGTTATDRAAAAARRLPARARDAWSLHPPARHTQPGGVAYFVSGTSASMRTPARAAAAAPIQKGAAGETRSYSSPAMTLAGSAASPTIMW